MIIFFYFLSFGSLWLHNFASFRFHFWANGSIIVLLFVFTFGPMAPEFAFLFYFWVSGSIVLLFPFSLLGPWLHNFASFRFHFWANGSRFFLYSFTFGSLAP